MYLKITSLVFVLLITFGLFSHANAQMMGNYGVSPSVSPNPTDIQQQQQDEAAGKQLFQQLQNKQTNCQKLTSSDFEKIGEYVMNQRFNDTNTHVQMNENIKKMMGENGEENMHTQLGLAATGCNTNGKGGVFSMIGWGGYGWSGMMGGNFGWFGIGVTLFWLVGFIDLILLGLFLWKQIKKK